MLEIHLSCTLESRKAVIYGDPYAFIYASKLEPLLFHIRRLRLFETQERFILIHESSIYAFPKCVV